MSDLPWYTDGKEANSESYDCCFIYDVEGQIVAETDGWSARGNCDTAEDAKRIIEAVNGFADLERQLAEAREELKRRSAIEEILRGADFEPHDIEEATWRVAYKALLDAHEGLGRHLAETEALLDEGIYMDDLDRENARLTAVIARTDHRLAEAQKRNDALEASGGILAGLLRAAYLWKGYGSGSLQQRTQQDIALRNWAVLAKEPKP